MVRKRVLVPLLAVAALILIAATASSVHRCATPSDGGGGGSTAADPGFCVPVSRGVMRVVYFFLGVLIARACCAVFDRFAEGTSIPAKKAGCVAIAAAADLEAVPGAGRKN